MIGQISAMRFSSTNMLCSDGSLFPFLSSTPVWVLSAIEGTNLVFGVQVPKK
jgi:hypothetical protein